MPTCLEMSHGPFLTFFNLFLKPKQKEKQKQKQKKNPSKYTSTGWNIYHDKEEEEE